MHEVRTFRWTIALLVVAVWMPSVRAQENFSSLVFPGRDGRLLYRPDALGNRIPDFSTVGYRSGHEPIPNVAELLGPFRSVPVTPGDGDDGNRIQEAIDIVSRLPVDATGFRGVVQLESGEFQIDGQLHLNRSGVVLRGRGDGTNPSSDTILRATGPDQRDLVVVGVTNGSSSSFRNTTHRLIDKYVPVGATSFRVDSTENWTVGDLIQIHRPSTSEWIRDLGMDQIPPRADGRSITQWTAGSRDQNYERVITRIIGNQVYIDAPLVNSVEQKYGGARATRIGSRRIENVGVENLTGISDFASDTDEDHAWTFIKFERAENAWARNVLAKHFGYAAVHVGRNASQVTVERAVNLDPKSRITGARRYAFNAEGQRILMKNLVSDQGRHDFVNNSPSRGPNVFLHGQATNVHSEAGPHQRWSTGTLFDNIRLDGDNLAAWNRGNFGSGHGWSGANMVFWNSEADAFRVQNPPTAQNWVVGGIGRVENPRDFLDSQPGIYDSLGHRVSLGDPFHNPTDSLYIAQLNERQADLSAETREYLFGDYDLLNHDANSTIDDPHVDPDWFEALQTMSDSQQARLVGFDRAADESQLVPFTFDFDLDDVSRIDRGVLTIAVHPMADLTENDWILIDDVANRKRLLDAVVNGPSLTDQTAILMMEFLDSDLDFLSDGRLHVAIGNNVGVDWARLEVSSTEMPMLQAGDVNQDLSFDQLDLVQVQVAAKYLTGQLATWGEGDWNGAPGGKPGYPPAGDGHFDQLDIVAALASNKYLTGTYNGIDVVSIPEPSTFLLSALAIIGLAYLIPHRQP